MNSCLKKIWELSANLSHYKILKLSNSVIFIGKHKGYAKVVSFFACYPFNISVKIT